MRRAHDGRRTRRLGSVAALVAAATVMTTAVATPAVAAPTRPTPVPFAPQDIVRVYASDTSSFPSGIYVEPIETFNELRAKHPEVMAQNMDTAVAINQSAKNEPALQARALSDAHDDPLFTMSDAFGSSLGAHFRAALYRLDKPECAR